MSKKFLGYAIAGAVISFSSVSLAYFTDGLVDTSFLSGLGANAPVYTTTLLTDGKYLVGGVFTGYDGTATNRITRLNSNGTIDISFNSGGQRANNIVRTTQQQSNGKYIIGGNFTGYDGVTINRIARLNTDGSLDTTFNPGSGLNTTVISSFLQSDDKVIIMGSFTNFSGTVRNRIARLNTDGTLDTTFNPGTLANATVYNLIQQPDTRYIVGGNFTTFNGTARTRIARITTGGVLDLTFGATTGPNNYISSMALQPDGKIIVGGLFTGYNSLPINRIARLTSGGLLDTTFNSGGVGANELIWSVRLQSDGKILIGGAFTAYNGTPVSGIARLHPDGSLDTTFNPGGLGANSDVYRNGMILQSDGKILIGGNFSGYNGTGVGYLTRLGYFTTGAITAPTKLSSGTITDTTFTITGTSNIYATGFSIDPSSTVTGSIMCNQTTPLQVDCNVTITNSGNLVIQGIDANGGILYVSENNYVIDKISPVIALTDDVNQFPNTGDTITVVVSDDLQLQTGTLLYGYSNDAVCNSGDSYTNLYQSGSSIVFTNMLYNGEYICFQAIDHVGNITYMGTTYPLLIDVTAPIVSIISGASVIENGIYTATFTGTDNLSGAIRYECQIDTGSWSLCYSTGYTIGGLGYGNHVFSVRGIDNAGNISSIVTRNFVYPAPIVGFGGGVGSTQSTTPINSSHGGQTTEPGVPSNEIGTVYNGGIENGKCYERGTGETIYQGNNVTMMFRKAHQMLYSYGLTKWQGTRDYRPEDTITREEAARFMVEYARNVLCRQKVRVYENNFADIEEADSTLQNYIKLSYEYGIFKGAEGKFKPKSTITTDELSAIIVRLVTNSFLEEVGEDWAKEYRTALAGYAKASRVTNIVRSNIAEVMYDVYRNNEYERKPVGYVIK